MDLARSKCPNVVGVKYTDSDFADLGRCAMAGYNVLVGADNMLLSALATGADGAIGITYSFAGSLHNEIFENFHKGNMEKCNNLQEKSRLLLEKLKIYGLHASCKHMMEFRGFGLGPLRWPQSNLNEEEKNKIKNDEGLHNLLK